MRIKKYFLPFFLPVIAVLCFVFLSPAFADMKKVDEAELARTNASVTGAPVKDWNASAVSADGTFDKTVLVSSPPNSKGFSLNLPSLGPETWTYNFGAYDPNYVGILTGVKSH